MLGQCRPSYWLFPLIFFAALLGGCGGEDPHEGRVVIDYWEVWSGFERDAMQDMVNEFNTSQDRIFVNFLSVSQMDRKLMLATAGGNPPDVAGLRSSDISLFAENGALTPLDSYAAHYGITESDYLPAIWNLLILHGRLWALPTTPGTTALHWNKHMFREAGLDPEKPPRTIAELEAYNEQITRFNERGEIEVMGHLPQEPGWWQDSWCFWFGGSSWNGKDTITADSPSNLRALNWMATYPARFGQDRIMAFRDVSGKFDSPQNPFFHERLAMVLQGPWMYNFIQRHASEDFEWGVAPFPSEKLEDYGVNIVETNLLVIPKGAPHPAQAFEFIAWMQQPKQLEELNLKQRKFSPLAKVSESFYERHPNPYIRIYCDLAANSKAVSRPRLTTLAEYQADMINAYDAVCRQVVTPEEALGEVQQRQQKLFDRMYSRWQKVEDVRQQEWSQMDAEVAP